MCLRERGGWGEWGSLKCRAVYRAERFTFQRRPGVNLTVDVNDRACAVDVRAWYHLRSDGWKTEGQNTHAGELDKAPRAHQVWCP